MTNYTRRIAALLTATALSLGAVGFAAPTLAQEAGVEETPRPAAPSNAQQVNPDAEVSLTINKFLGDPGDTSTPLEGAQFRIEKVSGVDLTTQEGWAAVAGMTAEDAPIDGGFQAVNLTTGANGTATLTTGDNSAFTVGVYKVTEVSRDGFTNAAPFLVTLPRSADGGWVYEQTVNPKNQQNIPTKQVDDTNATIGSTINYTINAPVPAGDLNRFNVVDPLDAALSVDTADVEVSAEGVDLAAGDYDVLLEGNTLRVNFTQAGRDKLQAARANTPGLKVVVGVPATLNSIPEGGQLNNTATIELPNGAAANTNGDDPNTDPVEDNPTSTIFGNLTITKTTPEANGTLNGAEFQLYQCKADGDDWQLLGEPLQMATTATGTPADTIATTGGDADGGNATATGYGIPIQSFAAGTGTTPNEYCVMESKAPEGYVINPEPQHVTIDLAARQLSISVENQKNSILGQLPATGAWGIILIFLIGLALLARGIYTSYKDSHAQA